MAAIGENTMRWAGSIADGVILHTFFTDETLARCVAAIRQGAEEAGRDPERVRVVVGRGGGAGHLRRGAPAPHAARPVRTYLQATATS
jgi:alkanesulfonate monooxygenase SsuD/methylene tetrahydromethanopterin reductase-like flavin-dependent oxidoreductase (luciferase family)